MLKITIVCDSKSRSGSAQNRGPPKNENHKVANFGMCDTFYFVTRLSVRLLKKPITPLKRTFICLTHAVKFQLWKRTLGFIRRWNKGTPQPNVICHLNAACLCLRNVLSSIATPFEDQFIFESITENRVSFYPSVLDLWQFWVRVGDAFWKTKIGRISKLP